MVSNKKVEQINDIIIDVSKEDVLKEFVTKYKYNHNVVTKDEYLENITEKVLKILSIIGFVIMFVYILFISPMDTNTDSALENAANELINMMIRIAAFAIPFGVSPIILHVLLEL